MAPHLRTGDDRPGRALPLAVTCSRTQEAYEYHAKDPNRSSVHCAHVRAYGARAARHRGCGADRTSSP
ncbi:hypothetical protein SMA90_29830 [Escherichia coli]